MNRIIVVGAGVAGLTAAHALSSETGVLVVDRLPACGGILSFDHPAIRALVRRAERGHITFALGATATRWTGDQLLVASPQAIRWEPGSHLVYAGGSRPSTPAELCLHGVARLAGVFAAPVAMHLLEAHVDIGQTVAVVGNGDWANAIINELRHHDVRVINVSSDDGDASHFHYPIEQYFGWTPTTVSGKRRVSELIIERHGATQRVLCDAVVLAAQQRPLRNVEGAIAENDSTTFIQYTAQQATIDEVVHHARDAAEALIQRLGETDEGHIASRRVPV